MEARRGIPEEADEEVGWEEAMRFLLSQTKAKVTQKNNQTITCCLTAGEPLIHFSTLRAYVREFPGDGNGWLVHGAAFFPFTCMFGSRPKTPDEKRYYLLPGQGRGYRRKHRMQLLAAILAGAVFAALLALLMWWTHSAR